ncbi:hypothetical protein ACFV2X_38355 [Streptomyces sp. NPDC059679]|uniref:hypothetical protein n=1 Tax=Streptomyces sp. NPDC059679 TaxID=3346903 RepID=UPI0036C63653
MTDYREDQVTQTLADYLAKREAARADRVRAFLDSLTDRERILVKDLAVLGYTQGLKRPRDEGCPKDSQVVSLVVEAGAAIPASPTARERGLIHDAAVMGYVQGLMRTPEDGGLEESAVVHLVVDACFAFPDLYPAVALLERCPRFPEGCPNLRAVPPNPPEHDGGVRCGCADDEEV